MRVTVDGDLDIRRANLAARAARISAGLVLPLGARTHVYVEGERIAQVASESAQEAAEVVREWEERDGVECEVEDLAGHHEPTDVLTPEPEDGL